MALDSFSTYCKTGNIRVQEIFADLVLAEQKWFGFICRIPTSACRAMTEHVCRALNERTLGFYR